MAATNGCLAGKVALVTGGATGIGEADEASYVTSALWFVDRGITVAEGVVGGQVPKELARRPEGELELAPSRDGRAG